MLSPQTTDGVLLDSPEKRNKNGKKKAKKAKVVLPGMSINGNYDGEVGGVTEADLKGLGLDYEDAYPSEIGQEKYAQIQSSGSTPESGSSGSTNRGKYHLPSFLRPGHTSDSDNKYDTTFDNEGDTDVDGTPTHRQHGRMNDQTQDIGDKSIDLIDLRSPVGSK